MPPEPGDELVRARQDCGITQDDLWMRYFALGGMSPPLELDAIVHDALHTSSHDRDLVVHALNERFSELGCERSIAYSDESSGAPDLLADSAPEQTLDTAVAESTEEELPAASLRRAVDTLGQHDASLLRRLAQAQQYAYRDALTGALQREAGQDQLQRAVDQAHRTDQPLTLVFLDVDHLKQTNDTHGHAAGDALLQALGGALRDSLRSYDVVVRYGGDELVCALPHAGLAQATERMNQVTARLGSAVPGASVSVGYASLREGETFSEVLHRADEDMYETRRRQRSTLSTRDHLTVVTPDTGYAGAFRAFLIHLYRVVLARTPPE